MNGLASVGRRPWLVVALLLVFMGVALEGYQLIQAVRRKTPGAASLLDVERSQMSSGNPRHDVIRGMMQLLNSHEKDNLAKILRESLANGEPSVEPRLGSEFQQHNGKPAFPVSFPLKPSGSIPATTNADVQGANEPSPTEGKSTGASTAAPDGAENVPKMNLPPKAKGKVSSKSAGKQPAKDEAPPSVEGEVIAKQLNGNEGRLEMPNGLQGGSVIKLSGTFNGACFAFELMDADSKDIQHHINFRPKRNQVVSSNYIGDWGTEYYYNGGFPLQNGEKFELALKIIAPKVVRQPWTLEVVMGEKKLYESLLVPNFFDVQLVRVTDVCANGGHNSYEKIEVHNSPKTPLEAPSMEYTERVTPEKPSKDTIMLLGILSAPKNKKHRGAQRRAWLNHPFCTSGKGLVRFFVGKSGNEQVDRAVEKENEKTGDIIILPDHKEAYYNIAGKTRAMVHYSVEIGAQFLLKCDDDTYVDIDQVVQGINGKSGGLVLAAITYNGGAQRHGKWAMPVSDYPHSRYPPFPHGPGYIIGADILKYADRELKAGKLRPLALEDVSMGVWIDDARKNGVHVNYQSRKGTGRGGVNIGGCHPGAMVSHYMLPEQMICMWEKQQQQKSNLCC
eukprot:CAMPEP_0114505832 /NCGR_PEP_ID=MMETSP0109-20121206/11072_1 /TAXON_ID=29199 /ORGANISM="Chlorarachnion reptans, Strain CCCM449" /LENGTH=617 /DNA_ID=CAMNT_0001684315 /DNA_START=119 /DNA_END=1975 /DNA_ORIENTATION=-